jgi:hypothetical protein
MWEVGPMTDTGPTLLVFGGRDYADRHTLRALLDRFARRHGMPRVLIHGAYRGADTLARDWARDTGVRDWAFPADWHRGARAGPERNARMLEEGHPTHAIGFPGSAGSTDMAERALRAPFVILFLVDAQGRPRRIDNAADLAAALDAWAALRPHRQRV